MTLPLTPRAQDLLRFLQGYLAAYGRAPTFAEMSAGIGAKSPSTVVRLVGQLEERGHIQRIPNRARCIGLTTPPEPRRSGPSFDGVGPFAPNLPRASLCVLSEQMATRLSRYGYAPQNAAAIRWLRTLALDPRARDGALRACDELPSRDLRRLLSEYLPGRSEVSPNRQIEGGENAQF